jgi:hypothetical protein
LNESFVISKIPSDLAESLKIPLVDTRSSDFRSFSRREIIKNSAAALFKLPNIGYSSSLFMYRFLAQRQGISHAATPIHTVDDYRLYNRLLREHRDTIYKPAKQKQLSTTKRKQLSTEQNQTPARQKHPNFDSFARLWSSFVNCKTIFYKTSDQIRSHYNRTKDINKYHATVEMNIETCEMIRVILQDPSRITMPVAPLPQPQQKTVPLPVTRMVYNPPMPRILIPKTPSQIVAPSPYEKPRKNRTCAVCRDDTLCSGKSNPIYCNYKCGHCGQSSCPGRYPKKKYSRESTLLTLILE